MTNEAHELKAFKKRFEGSRSDPRRLTLADREEVECGLSQLHAYGFYFNFPMILAQSETATRHFTIWDGVVYTDQNEVYYPYAFDPYDSNISTVLVSPFKSRLMGNELYDVEYVYDLNTTMEIKNFRDNVKVFERDNKQVSHEELTMEKLLDAVKLLEAWYDKHIGAIQDFGYTMYLLEHFNKLDLLGHLFYINGEPKGLSLCMYEHSGNRAIHFVSKDLGQPYLQDWMRSIVYGYLYRLGVQYVYDGSDCGDQGLMVYKHKLRPKLILPIYKWSKEEPEVKPP